MHAMQLFLHNTYNKQTVKYIYKREYQDNESLFLIFVVCMCYRIKFHSENLFGSAKSFRYTYK